MGGRHFETSFDTSARKYGFRDSRDLEDTFNLGKPGNPFQVDGQFSQCLSTMDKIKKLYGEWQETPQGTHNWRDTLTLDMWDGRTRRDICRDNLNKYLDTVQHDWGLSDSQMKKICGKMGVPVNEKARVAMNSDLDKKSITTDIRPTMAFNSIPANIPVTTAAQPAMRVTASGPAPGVAA